MTMLAIEPAICKKCGNKQNYTKVITWNTWLDPEFPGYNKCYNCGKELKYEDIDMSSCTPKHRGEVRFHKIYERLSLKENNNNNDEEEITCSKCGSTKLSRAFSCGIKLPDKYKDKENYHVSKSYYSCGECGHERYLSLEEILSCALYEFVENGEEEHEYIVKEVDNYQEIINERSRQMKEKFEQIENELISEGLITTREEEQEYRDKYDEELRNKYN